jgi:nucleotide-binding universal stress UspA family protein
MMAPAGEPTDVDPRYVAERVISAAADRARNAAPSLDIRTALVPEAPAGALVDASADAELVVVGHRGLGGFTGLLLGSVGARLTAHAACPVVVVRGGGHDRRSGAGRAGGPVVVGVDGSGLSDAALAFAFGHASLHGLDLVAVHAYALPALTAPSDAWLVQSDVTGWHDDHVRFLTGVLVGYQEKYPDVPVREKVVPGRAAELLGFESAGATLTVIGSRGRGGVAGLVLGSTSQGLLHRAAGPVAVVRESVGRRSRKP